jgi:hypothetical protein
MLRYCNEEFSRIARGSSVPCLVPQTCPTRLCHGAETSAAMREGFNSVRMPTNLLGVNRNSRSLYNAANELMKKVSAYRILK